MILERESTAAPGGAEITIIICSINPGRCEKTLRNIAETIGVKYETIVFDNRERNWGICKAYNHCARTATAPYLCFMHEDVLFGTRDWGKSIIAFFEKTPGCGVVGFAGGLQARKNLTSWWSGENRININDGYTGGDENYWKLHYRNRRYINPENEPHAQVVCVDGMFQFVQRSVWEAIQYDEHTYAGFHFYDIDFSFAAAQKHQNYVLFTIDVFHDSPGSLSAAYIQSMFAFQLKWKGKLPYYLRAQSKFAMLRAEFREALIIHADCGECSVKMTGYLKQLRSINPGWFMLIYPFYFLCKRVLQITINILEKIDRRI